MTTTDLPHTEISQRSLDFFAPIALSNIATPTLESGPATLPSPVKSVYGAGDGGLVSCILAEEIVTPELQAQLDRQKQNLIDLCGVASAQVRSVANRLVPDPHNKGKKVPNSNAVYDTNLWQEVFNHLPQMGPSQYTKQSYDRKIYDGKVATAFIETIMGFAVGGGTALAGFASFLKGLGGSIGAGVKRTEQSFSTAAITIVLKTQRFGNEVQLVPSLKGYFIDFTDSQTTVYSSCGSASTVHMTFNYRVAETMFNFAPLEDKDGKPTALGKSFSGFITRHQVDDIAASDDYFNNVKVDPDTSPAR